MLDFTTWVIFPGWNLFPGEFYLEISLDHPCISILMGLDGVEYCVEA